MEVLQKNDEGVLVTKQGYEVLADEYLKTGKGKISFTSDDNIIVSDKNGQMSTNIPNSTKLTPNKKLLIVQPKDLSLLKKEGSGFILIW